MPNINNENNMRIYDFNTLKKSFKIQDVSNYQEYSIPKDNMPNVKDQGDYCWCVACVIVDILEVFNFNTLNSDNRVVHDESSFLHAAQRVHWATISIA